MSQRISLKEVEMTVAGERVAVEDGFLDYGDDHPLDDSTLSPFEHMVEILARPAIVEVEVQMRIIPAGPNGQPVIDVDGESED